MRYRLKGALKSRTCWLGLAVSVAGVVQANIDAFSFFLTPKEQGLVTFGVGLAVVVLRFVTNQALDEK